MSIFRKTSLFILIGGILGISSAFSAYYGNHAVSFSNPGATYLPTQFGGGPNRGTPCDDDGDGDGTNNKIALNNSSSTLQPHNSTTAIAELGDIRCLYWDATMPTTSGNNNSSTWKASDISVTLSVGDTGGSGISYSRWRLNNADCVNGGSNFSNGDTITITDEGDNTLYLCAGDVAGNLATWNGQYKLDKSNVTGSVSYSTTNWTNQDIVVTVTCDDSNSTSGCDMSHDVGTGWTANIGNKTYTKTFQSNTSGNITLKNIAGNTQSVSYEITKIDKQAPQSIDISGAGVFLAGSIIEPTSSKDFSISVDSASGSPITLIQGYFEGPNVDFTPFDNDLQTSPYLVTANSDSLTLDRDISKVNTNGSREYTFIITNIQDEAGNQLAGSITYNYNVLSSTPIEPEDTFTGTLLIGDYDAIVEGNYNERFLKVTDGGNDKIFAISSMIVTGSGDIDLSQDLYNLAMDGSANLPSTYENLGFLSGGTYLPQQNILIYDIPSKGAYSDSDLNIIANKIKGTYRGSSLSTDDNYKDVFSSDNQLKDLLSSYLNRGIQNASVVSDNTSSLWRAEDSNCTKNDIVVGSQTWAPCNSTLGTKVSISSATNSCFNYAGAGATCSSLSETGKESDLAPTESSNIWGGFYQYTNINSACPTGWRVPTNNDWETLESNLLCTDQGTFGWRCDGLGWKRDTGIYNNIINLLGLPLGGYANSSNILQYRGYTSGYWTSTANGGNTQSVIREFYYNNTTLNKIYTDRASSYNVRCIKE